MKDSQREELRAELQCKIDALKKMVSLDSHTMGKIIARLCSKENFGEPFGLPSISAGVPTPPSWSPVLIINYLFN